MPKAKILKGDCQNFSALRDEERNILNYLDKGARTVTDIQQWVFGPSLRGNYEARRFLRRVVRTGLVQKVTRGKYKLAAETRRMMARHILGRENLRD